MSVWEFFNALFITVGIVIIIEFFKFCLIIAVMERISIVKAGRLLIGMIEEEIRDRRSLIK